MNKKIFITLIIILSNSILFAQAYYGKSWMIGLAGIFAKFDNSSYIFDTTNVSNNSQTAFLAGKSSICDSNGNIHLISDGLNVYDAQGNYIIGGDTLANLYYYNYQGGMSPYSQSSIFLPMDSGKCYFILPTATQWTIDNIWFNSNLQKAPFDQLYFNEINMYSNNGKGVVTKRMQKLLENVEISKTQMMACRHGNGKDWWLLKKASDSNNVYTFLVTQDSIYNKGIQRLPFPMYRQYDNMGQMMFNNDGTQIATTQNDLLGIVYIADFDRCYGTLSNYQKIQVPAQPSGPVLDSTTTGVCFSPNNQFLYVAKYDHILQYNLTDNTWFYVHYKDTTDTEFQGYNTMYLAPNNKIYIGNWNGFSKQMSSIDNPNLKGNACNFCRKCFKSPKVLDGFLKTPPCVPNYGLDAMPNCWPLSSEQLAISSEQLEVYPNPSSTIFEVRGSKKGSKKELYNSIGQLIISTKENEIDVHNLSKGIYYLKVGNQTKKVVVE